MMQVRTLVVDDSQSMRRSLVRALCGIPGLVCVEAEDGAQGVKLLSGGQFDLVLTDINMPIMDGLKLISHIRQSSEHRAVPVIVISTEGAQEDRERALALGASAYLVKPVQGERVLQAVKGLLNLG